MLQWRTLLFLAWLTTEAHAEQFTARIIAVLDGDTVMAVRRDAPPMKIRLAEIDAPEISQPRGTDAKKTLSELLLHKWVTVDSHAVDRYGRRVAHVTVNGMQVNEHMLRAGMAWEYSYFHRNERYIALQSESQQAKRGIWRDATPLPPWQWRKLHAEDESDRVRHSQLPGPLVTAEYVCGNKRRCTEMLSCDEAYFYFIQCDVKSLDMNRDGVPCDRLCSDIRY